VNQDHAFLPGSFVEIEVPLTQSAEALMVPTEAVIPTAEGAEIFVVRDGKAALQKIVLGERTAERVEVVEGLAAGDQVVISNLLRLRANAAVTIASSREGNQAPAAANGTAAGVATPTPTPAQEG
jgi:membrane fusion protein (multidrug efflux system)